MEQIQENMENCFTEKIKRLQELGISGGGAQAAQLFKIIRKIIQIENWLKVSHIHRNSNFDEMKKTLELELFLRQSFFPYSLIPELLLMINKQSNTLFFKFIKMDLVQEVEKGKVARFYLIYDLLKHKNSICMRERLSRESIIELVGKDLEVNRQG